MAKQWDENAATAKQIAKNIITGEEVNKKGERLIHVVYRLDTFASDALNRKYAQYGSQANIHTYDGGRQTIDTQHADGTTGHFESNGNNNPTNNAMDIEIEDYINNHLDESKNYKNMKKNVQRINESQLRAIVAESVKKVLNEMEFDNRGMEVRYLNCHSKDDASHKVWIRSTCCDNYYVVYYVANCESDSEAIEDVVKQLIRTKEVKLFTAVDGTPYEKTIEICGWAFPTWTISSQTLPNDGDKQRLQAMIDILRANGVSEKDIDIFQKSHEGCTFGRNAR